MPLSAIRTHLATDIHNRASLSAETVQLLEDGMSEDRLEHFFWWSQFWEAHRADDELQRLDSLQSASDEHRDEPADYTTSAEPETEAEEANKAFARIHELQNVYKPKVNWADAPRFGRLADSLKSAGSMSSLISRYEKLDADVGQLEKATDAAVSTWNELCEEAVQIRRGN